MKLISRESTIDIQNIVDEKFNPISTMSMLLYPIRVKITYTKKGESNNIIIFSGHHAPLHQGTMLDIEDFLKVFFPMLLDQNKKALELIENEIESKGEEFSFDEVKSKLNRIYKIDNQDQEADLFLGKQIIKIREKIILISEIIGIEGPFKQTDLYDHYYSISLVTKSGYDFRLKIDKSYVIDIEDLSNYAHDVKDEIFNHWIESIGLTTDDVVTIQNKTQSDFKSWRIP